MGIYRVGANGSAPKGLSVGDQVVTGGGTYRITNVDGNGGYTSELFNKDQTTYNYKGAYDRAPDSTQAQVRQNIAQGAANGNAASAFSASMNNYASQIKNYSDPYAGAISKQNSVVQNYAPFEYEPYSYDQRSDIRAANVKQTGTREIRRAVEDTLGNYAANTGGQASTAAASAAAQAGDYYAAQLTDQLNDVENEASRKCREKYHNGDMPKRQTALQQFHQNRRGDIVGQVGAHRNAALGKRGGEQSREVGLHHVLVHHLRVVKLVERVRQHRQKAAVDLEGDHPPVAGAKFARQRTDAGADLQHRVVRAFRAGVGNAPDHAGVGEKVLPELLAKAQTERLH